VAEPWIVVEVVITTIELELLVVAVGVVPGSLCTCYPATQSRVPARCGRR